MVVNANHTIFLILFIYIYVYMYYFQIVPGVRRAVIISVCLPITFFRAQLHIYQQIPTCISTAEPSDAALERPGVEKRKQFLPAPAEQTSINAPHVYATLPAPAEQTSINTPHVYAPLFSLEMKARRYIRGCNPTLPCCSVPTSILTIFTNIVTLLFHELQKHLDC